MTQCKEILKKRIEDEFFFKMLIPEETSIKEKLNEIILNTDKQIAFENKCDFKLSGCTFTLLAHFGENFYIANIGAAHCLSTTAKEQKIGPSSRGGASSIAGSEAFKASNMSGGSGITNKTAAFATTNPTKAVAFLYRATYKLTSQLYGGRITDLSLGDAKNTQIELLTNEHSVTNYEELLRLTQSGGVVLKDKKKEDLPYYAKPFKLYLDPLVAHPGLVQGSNWPAMRVSR